MRKGLLARRQGGEINYTPAQLLIGDKGYRHYLYRFKLVTSSEYLSCDDVSEDPKHVFLQCCRFLEKSRNQDEPLGDMQSPENIVQRMLTVGLGCDLANVG